MPGASVDVVYTWVDGAWPGYGELLAQHSEKKQDLNPNRYRDNLDVLRYSLRSLEAYVPWVRTVVLVTTRPQIPAWLRRDASGLRIVHHDEFIPAEHLPTFNSFAIVSNLHRIPGVSRRFLYMEDDRLFARPVVPGDLVTDDGRLRVYAKWETSPPARHAQDARQSPWNTGVALSNGLLDAAYRPAWRGHVKHTPLFINVEAWERMHARWPEEFRRTSASRFRALGNVVPEHLYPYYMLNEGRGVPVPRLAAYRDASYHGLGNWTVLEWAGLAALSLRRPKFYPLNDNFGERPNPRVVALARRWLERQYPRPSRFEAAA